MTGEQIDKLKKEELVDIVKSMYSNEAIINSYFEFEALLNATAENMAKFRDDIDLTADDANVQFRIISDYMKNVLTWTKNQKELLTMIDIASLREEKEKRLSAAAGTLEHKVNGDFMRKGSDSSNN